MGSMSALGYVRLSELTEASVSPDSQRAAIDGWAQSSKVELVGIQEDLDISGRRGVDRPGFTAALEAIERGEAEVLVVAKLDRIARSIVTFHEALARVEAVGGRMVSVGEGLDFSSPSGRMVASVLASFAEYESDLISGRVKAAQQYMASVGRWRGGRRPFGMRATPHPSGTGMALTLDPEEGPILREMISQALAGVSLTEIARGLNERGVLTANGKPWTNQAVRQSLRREGLHGAGGVEPLIGETEWVELQKAIKVRKQTKVREPAHPLLANVVCGRCGRPMTCTWVSSRYSRRDGDPVAYRVRQYQCSRAYHPGISKQCAMSVSADPIEEEVVRQALERFGRIPVERPSPTEELVDPAADARLKLEQAIEDLEADRYLRKLFTGERGAQRFAELHLDLEARLAALPEPFFPHTDNSEPTGLSLSEEWERADHVERPTILAAMIDHIVVAPAGSAGRFDPDRVELVWAP